MADSAHHVEGYNSSNPGYSGGWFTGTVSQPCEDDSSEEDSESESNEDDANNDGDTDPNLKVREASVSKLSTFGRAQRFRRDVVAGSHCDCH